MHEKLLRIASYPLASRRNGRKFWSSIIINDQNPTCLRLIALPLPFSSTATRNRRSQTSQ